MEAVQLILTIITVICALFLIAVVLLQSGKSAGLSGAIAGNGLRGVRSALTEISLLISMSFRLFGALLSGLLVTELVYYYTALSYVLPVVVGVLFTLLHALIQSYVLTTLTSLFYGEVSEHSASEGKKSKKQKTPQAQNA